MADVERKLIMAAMDSSVGERLKDVKGKIEELGKQLKSKQTPLLVAVSKMKPIASIQEAYDCGHRDFGENYLQELLSKYKELPDDIRWHFIGHIQSNKCKQLASIPNLALVQTIDTEKIATLLNNACESRPGVLPVCVEVNTSGEPSKFGCKPDHVVDLCRYIRDNCCRLQLRGLMTIGDFSDIPTSDCFERLSACRSTVTDVLGTPLDNLELSMGMSNDFELAIQHGSNIIRVGSYIFGARPPKA